MARKTLPKSGKVKNFLRRYAPQLLLFAGLGWMTANMIHSSVYLNYGWIAELPGINTRQDVPAREVMRGMNRFTGKGRELVGRQGGPILLMLFAAAWSCRRVAVASGGGTDEGMEDI